MKYMIFTTKHHDGFCMFDSRYTDFSIAHGPFADNPKADVAKYVFQAFRDKGFMTGCYFSKPDWHCKWFWNPYYATPNRMQNYKREQHPDWWRKYQRFTQDQLNELMTRYGKLDILWLDGGWVSGDDIGLDSVLAQARAGQQKGLICVDRTIQGRNENYQTPEQQIPDRQLNHPWESCITLTHAWGWIPNPDYKSANKVVALLAEVVAKGRRPRASSPTTRRPGSTRWATGSDATARPSTAPAPPPTTTRATSGSRPTRTTARSMPSMRWKTADSCPLPSRGKAMCQRAM